MSLWAFTFGSNHVDCNGTSLKNNYVVISGNFFEAREKLFAIRGPKWSMQYKFDDEFKHQIDKYRLVRKDLPSVAL